MRFGKSRKKRKRRKEITLVLNPVRVRGVESKISPVENFKHIKKQVTELHMKPQL